MGWSLSSVDMPCPCLTVGMGGILTFRHSNPNILKNLAQILMIANPKTDDMCFHSFLNFG